MLVRTLFGAVLVVSLQSVLAATAPIGTTPGSFSVDGNGGASYTVPISVSPGTAGMIPGIALSYTKQVENPLVGVGFSVSGLSIVHRCGRTIALDGEKGGVNYDNNDRLCLDGQRLLPVSGSVCGTNGTEYRTERESFGRICAYRDPNFTGSGPEYFKVTTKDGGTMEFGVTADSRIEAQGKTTVRLWALNKVQDVKSNYYTVLYNENPTNGEYSPSRIDYTGNVTTGTLPYNSVRFTYSTRPDIASRYEGGSIQKVTQRLSKIESYADSSVIRTYNLAYNNGGTPTGTTGASRLTSLTECGSDGVCLPPTTFNWRNGGNGFITPDYNAPGLPATIPGGYGTTVSITQNMLVADFNGDGIPDIMWVPPNSDARWLIAYGTPTGFTIPDYNAPALPATIPGGYGTTVSITQNMLVADFNGDGKADIMWVPPNSDGRWLIAYGTNTGFTIPDYNTPALPPTLSGGYGTTVSIPQNMHVGDFNGDGRADIMWVPTNSDGRWLIAYGAAAGFTVPDYNAPALPATIPGGYGTTVSIPQNVFVADFNGDGRPDLMWVPPNGDGRWVIAYASGTGFTIPDYNAPALPATLSGGYGTTVSITQNMRLGDFNGDGKADIMWVPTGSDARWLIAYGTGTGFTIPDYNTPALPATLSGGYGTTVSIPQNMLVADFNGDGKTDIMWVPPGSDARWVIAYGNGSDGGLSVPDYNAPALPAAIPGGYGTTVSIPQNMLVGDFNGDGVQNILWVPPNSDARWVNANFAGAAPDLLASVTNGFGVVAAVTYKPLTDSSVYTRDASAVYPYQDVQSPTYVVSRVTQSDGVGGDYAANYLYGGAKTHVTGPGWLGYRWTRVTDERTGISTVGYLNQTYNGTEGTPNYSETIVNGVVVKRQDSFWSAVDFGGGRKAARLDGTLDQSFELNGSLVSCASIDNSYATFDSTGNYGNYGLPTTVVAKTNTTCNFASAVVKTTTNTYSHDTTNWILGRLTRAQVQHQAPGQTTVTRTSGFAYNAQGLMTEETIEPDSSTLWLKTAYTYDSFGNRLTTTLSGSGFVTRSSSVGFDPRGRFPITTTNALGHTATATYDPKWGLVATQTDPNGLIVSFDYDGFGRKIQHTLPDGTQTTFSSILCDATNPCSTMANGVAPKYSVSTVSTGIAPSKTYMDILGRVVRAEGVSLNGTTVYQDTEYDTLGRVKRNSHPYFTSATPVWEGAGTTYDALGRVTSTTAADGQITTTTYNGLTNTVEVSGPIIITRSRTSVKNAAGQLVSVTDSLYPSQPTTYQYDAIGNLTKVIDPSSNQTTMVYDLRGNKTQMSDPDMGIWNYVYNSIGQLTSQTNAKSQTQTVTYDLLGRLKTRVTTEGTSTWTYDTATKGIGKFASVSGPSGYQASATYDSLGRPSTGTVTTGGQSYTTTTTYNALGQVNTTTYPSTGFAIKRIYNANGYLTEIRNNQNNALYWQANQNDALGHITQETLGNGLTTTSTYDATNGSLTGLVTTGTAGTAQNETFTFDVLGNLLSRRDNLQSLTENFAYDTLNRLTQVTGPASKTYQYNVLGNVTSKSDVGTYTYGTKPHAVTATSGTLNSTYVYDNNGNLTSGAGRTVTWTSFNKPTTITKGSASETLTYDSDFNRIKKVAGTATTIYIGGLYQKVTTGTLVEHKHFIGAGRAQVVYTQRSTNVNDTRYLHTDHLGSVDTITNETGAVVQRLSNDAHGKRRNSNWTDATGTISAQTTVGYTGHEMDDETGLINMRAREYDPVLGRFMSSDTIVESSFGQGLNRYTYVQNNPLSLTDPTGHLSNRGKNIFKHTTSLGFYFGIVKPKYHDAWLAKNPGWIPVVKTINTAIGAFFSVASAGYSNYAAVAANAKMDQGVCRASGGGVGDCNSAGFKSLGIGIITVDIYNYIGWNYSGWEKVAAHAVAGGTTNYLRGGSFGEGFVSGGFGAAVGGDDLFTRAIVGGISAELTGGKFANGAMTAAFAYLLNDAAHSTPTSRGSIDLEFRVGYQGEEWQMSGSLSGEVVPLSKADLGNAYMMKGVGEVTDINGKTVLVLSDTQGLRVDRVTASDWKVSPSTTLKEGRVECRLNVNLGKESVTQSWTGNIRTYMREQGFTWTGH